MSRLAKSYIITLVHRHQLLIRGNDGSWRSSNILVFSSLFLFMLSKRPRNVTETLSVRTPDLLLSFCRQIASGMSYLSGKGFIHRDLAARNILVSRDEMCKVGGRHHDYLVCILPDIIIIMSEC